MKNEETIFNEALLKTSPQERAAFIAEACAGDVDLRLEVEALLEAHEQRGGVLESPPAGIEPTAGASDLAGDPSEQVGAVVGHYKLLQQIGEGGMGVVFMAEQFQPVRRRVAVKIIKPGLDTRQVIARFEAERQALAMMDHPNIAKVLDAGATDAGRPYFVMELVKGVPITEYCDQQQLNPRERLALFIQVCQAVQHAHTKGIIHRDLKPTNVLVTLNDGHPAPKIIDFGIAKATVGQRLTDRTLFTEFRQLIGTPLYMSPEQAEMSVLMDVDTRSDVYSLGVLLYELLTGTTPFDKQRLAKAAFEEVRRILREEEPPRLSTRLSTLGETLATISASRSSDPKRLGQLMRGELDWIAMKALEKDRDRRYGTPSDLARDVERYLADQPVEACPPARFYRFRTMVRRNKAAITTAAVLGIVLLLATGISTWQAVLASRAKLQLKHQRDVAEHQAIEAIRLQHAAEIESAQRLVSEGDALLMTHRTGNAQNRFTQARQLFQKLGEPTIQADLGLWESAGSSQLLSTFAVVDVTCAACCPNSRIAVTGGKDGVVRLWDLMIAREMHTMRGHNGPVNDIAISPDGSVAVSAGQDGLLNVWDLATGSLRQTFRGHIGAVHAVALFDGDTKVISGGDDGILRIWDVKSAREIRTLADHAKSKILCLDLSIDGSTVVSGTYDSFVSVWDLKAGKLLKDFLRPGRAPIGCIAVSPDGQTIFAGERASAVLTRWSRDDGSHFTVSGHTNDMSSIEIIEDGSNTRALSAGTDGRMILWNIFTMQNVGSMGDQSDRLNFAHWTAKGGAILAGGGRMRLWNAEDGQRMRVSFGTDAWIYGVSVSRDGRLAASGGDARHGQPVKGETHVRIWDPALGRTLCILRGHDGPVWSTAFSPNAAQLLSASQDATLKLWDVASGRLVRTFTGHSGPMRMVAFLDDGLNAVSGSEDGTIQFWRLGTGEEFAKFHGSAAPLRSMAVDAAQNNIVVGSIDGSITLWPITGGESPKWVRTHPGAEVLAAAIAPDGKQVLSGYSDGMVELTDVSSGMVIRSFHAHNGPVFTVAYMSEGKAFITGGQDRELKIWNTADCRELHTIAASETNSVAVSANGNMLVSGGMGRVLQFCNLGFPAVCRSFDQRLTEARSILRNDPENGAALSLLGEWYALNEVDDWAIELLQRARRAGADVSPLILAQCHWRLDDGESALPEFQMALRRGEAPLAYLQLFIHTTDPANIDFCIRRAAHHIKVENFQDAAADFAQAQLVYPDDDWISFRRGCLLAFLADVDAYRAQCVGMLKRFGQTHKNDTACRNVKTVLLLPSDADGRASKDILAQLEPSLRTIETSDGSNTDSWQLQVRGMFQYRSGRYIEAIDLFQKSVANTNEFSSNAESLLYLAMSLRAAGNHEEAAQEALQKGSTIINDRIAKIRGDIPGGFQEWLVCQVALREARKSFGLPVTTTWPSAAPTTMPATRPAAATQPGNSNSLKNAQDARP